MENKDNVGSQKDDSSNNKPHTDRDVLAKDLLKKLNSYIELHPVSKKIATLPKQAVKEAIVEPESIVSEVSPKFTRKTYKFTKTPKHIKNVQPEKIEKPNFTEYASNSKTQQPISSTRVSDNIDISSILKKYASDSPDKLEKNEKDEDNYDNLHKFIAENCVDEDQNSQFDKKEKNSSINKNLQQSIKNAENYITEKSRTEEMNSIKLEHKETEYSVNKENLPGNFDATDLNLMLAFGMNDELEKNVSREKINELEAEMDKDFDENFSDIEENENASSGNKSCEYIYPSQTKEIFKQYETEYNHVLLKFFSCSVFVLLIFVFENISMINMNLPAIFNPNTYPFIYVMIDLQLLVFSVALIYKHIFTGIVNLVKLKPSPESITFLLILIAFVYSIGVCVIGVKQDLKMYNSPVALCILLTILYEFMNLKREILSFKIVSSKKIKYVIDKLDNENAHLEKAVFSDYITENSTMFKINKASFVDGFFERTNKVSNSKKTLSILIPAVIAVAAIFFVISYAKSKNIYVGMSMSYISLLLCTPLSIFVTYSYPFYKASKKSFELDSAIIGETSLKEYSNGATISFNDNEVFPSYGIKVKSVNVYDNSRIDHVLYNAASIFHSVGGSLSDVFDIATVELGHSDDVEIIQVFEDGLTCTIDGRTVLVGKNTFVKRCGIEPNYSEDDHFLEESSEISIMYMIYDDIIAAKLYIQYEVDADFEIILKYLYKAGMCIGIKTFDPNINDKLLGQKIKLSKYPVKILRCSGIQDISETEQRVNSGIVSKGSAKSLLQTVSLCDKVLHITKINVTVKVLAMIIGIIIMTFVSVSDVTSDVSSLYISLYQIFWILPMFIIAKLYI